MTISFKQLGRIKKPLLPIGSTLFPAICMAVVAAGCAPPEPTAPKWYFDSDADGYGTSNISIESADQPDGYVSSGADCNDADASINPAATEIYDGADNNCNGEIDEGFTLVTWYADSDSDTYGDPSMTTEAVNKPTGYVANNEDCNDNDGGINPAATEEWDYIDNNCDGAVDEGFTVLTWYYDGDSDGFGDIDVSQDHINQPANYVADDTDCDDSNGSVNPAAPELDNGADDNCNNQIDEGLEQTWYLDNDSDSYGDPDDSVFTSSSLKPANYIAQGDDCDDGNANINPGAVEQDNGIDDNCNGDVDEGIGVQNWYQDGDSDGWGTGTPVSATAGTKPAGYVSANGDCNDANPAINPGAGEADNGIDDNCNNQIDEGLEQTWYLDADGDAYGDPGTTAFTSSTLKPANYIAQGGDCNDGNASINPGAAELDNGIDDNCNNQTDEGFAVTDWYFDGDNDSYGTGSAVSATAGTKPAGYVANGGDCNDGDASINPGATELDNNIDDNCDGQTDEGFVAGDWYNDGDNDGYGDPNDSVYATPGNKPAGYIAQGGDCNDSNANINPGAAEQDNGIDDNCDSQIDEGLEQTWYADSDNDSYGDPDTTAFTSSTLKPAGYIAQGGDCNDGNANINPGAAEQDNGIDDNCNSQIDEGFAVTAWYLDGDSDGYGAGSAVLSTAGTKPANHIAQDGDCNDNNSSINPGAAEQDNGIDDNCNNQVDEGLEQTWYLDGDNDGYGDANTSVFTSSSLKPAGYIAQAGDCNDSNGNIKPGATELDNGIDDNCNGQTDEGLEQTWYNDSDGDGFGDSNDSVFTSLSLRPVGYIAQDGDCNDSNASIKPGAAEVDNGIDDNCDGQTDEGLEQTWYFDGDGDDYGVSSNTVSTSLSLRPANYVAANGDCNDGDGQINPGADEVADYIDNNCDGNIDEGFTLITWYFDSDGDGYGISGTTDEAYEQPVGYAAQAGDCDDSLSAVNPGATEIPNNGIDDDCNPATSDVPQVCYDQVIEVTYNINNSSYTISGTILGAGDGTTSHESSHFGEHYSGTNGATERYITVRYDDVDENGVPDANGRADVVAMSLEIDMKTVSTNFFAKGTVWTEITTWLDDLSATGFEATSNDLPAAVIPGVLNSGSSVIALTGGKLVNYKGHGYVRCRNGDGSGNTYLGDSGAPADPWGTPQGTPAPMNPGDTGGTVCSNAGVGWQNGPATNPNLGSMSVSTGVGTGTISFSVQIASKDSSGSNDIAYGKPGNVTMNIDGVYGSMEVVPAACE